MRAILMAVLLFGVAETCLATGISAKTIDELLSSYHARESKKVPDLEKKAAKGDAKAAWQLFGFYSSSPSFPFQGGYLVVLLHEGKATFWLRRSAELGWPDAERLLAFAIKNLNLNPAKFGKSQQEAVYSLYLKAAKKHASSACKELAECYESGYGGRRSLSAARYWYTEGARSDSNYCWRKAAEYLFEGKGGPPDLEEGYFWISAEHLCFDPQFTRANEDFKIRKQYEKQLTLVQLERVWKRLDSFIEQAWAGKLKLDNQPFLGKGTHKSRLQELRKSVVDLEDAHRLELRNNRN